MIFETERLIIRKPTWDDGDDFYILNSNPDIVRFIRAPRTRAESDEKLKEKIETNNAGVSGLGHWAADSKAEQKLIGTFGLFLLPGSDEVNMGYSLHLPYWGLGYASEMARGGIKYGFEKLHLPKIIATTFPENFASQKILIKCGFTQIGSFVEDGQDLFKFEILNRDLIQKS